MDRSAFDQFGGNINIGKLSDFRNSAFCDNFQSYMIRSLFFLYFFVSFVLTGHSQSTAQPRANPSLPGYSGFLQPWYSGNYQWESPFRNQIPFPKLMRAGSTATAAVQSSSLPTKGNAESLKLSSQAGTRAYSTSNVLRQDSSLARSSGVFESSGCWSEPGCL